ncbi:hypothetical protein GRN51_410 [Salmonella phage GRNsp51]|uniref:Uncharacterized protein n=1 Tax=Salmonella phage GRNsp51 TaxID=2948587 RepID=A0A9E7IM47_9CAUD|nr:hypothetical protein GRN51_410 [Salmonella phage GRNsp51]
MTTENTVVSVREAATAEIKVHLDTIGTAYLKVGSLLNELRGDFENQRDFLSYVEAEFSIKKAQCYNLMNVARCFDGDERFKGVAMRVMLALVPFADEAGIMDKAAELAADGKLDTKAVNTLVSPSKPSKPEAKQSQPEETKANESAAQEAQEPQSVPQGDTSITVDDSAPWDETEETPKAPEAKAAPVENQATAENAAMAGLLSQIKALTEQLQAANDRIAELTSTRETKKASAPMLPQFKSKCFYARLGLSAEEAEKKTTVNKAKRELVKLGYGEGHEAWDLIQEAVTALIEK